MASSPPPRQGMAGFLFAPLVVGLGYGAVRAMYIGRSLTIDPQGPFMTSLFAGVLLTLALRPVLSRLPWSREAALALALSILAGVGLLGEWCAAWIAAQIGAAPFPMGFPGQVGDELLGVIVAGFIMAMLFRPQSGTLDFGALRLRLAIHTPRDWLNRLVVLIWGVMLVWLVLGWAESALGTAGLLPDGSLSARNFWLELTGQVPAHSMNGNGESESGTGSALLLLLVYMLRAAVLVIPLVPIALAVRGESWQLLMLFGLLLFIVGEFVPLMHDQPFSSTPWLLARTALGAIRAGLLAGLVVATVGLVKPADG